MKGKEKAVCHGQNSTQHTEKAWERKKWGKAVKISNMRAIW